MNTLVTRMEKVLGVRFDKSTVRDKPALVATLRRDKYETMDAIRAVAIEAEREGAVCFVGHLAGDDGHRVFLLPGVSSLDVIELFGVGEHNGGAEPAVVRETLAAIRAEAPFSVYFADGAGYKAVFADAVASSMAADFEQRIFAIDPDAMSLADDGIAEEIEREGILQLWWD
jgi:hypothetical protein